MHKKPQQDFHEFHGISANAVAYKAAQCDPQTRKLLFFLQAMSLRPEGLRGFVADFLAEFPERLGTKTMHAHKLRNDESLYPVEISETIEDEINPPSYWEEQGFALREMWGEDVGPKLEKRPRRTRAALLKECQTRTSEDLLQFIKNLCVDRQLDPETCWVPCFRDIEGALVEYQARLAARTQRAFVMTEIAQRVFDTLDIALDSPGRIALIEGCAGVGKTAASKAWSAQHSGEARFVSLRGITNRTTFFHALATALGIQIASKTVADMQTRIEDVLHRCKLLLVIDEAQFLLPSVDTVRKQPELLDWLYTACSNFNVPVALVCTALFAERVRKVEQRVTWDADRFERRMRPYVQLPQKVRKEDLVAVAQQCVPHATQDMINVLVGYAGPSKYQLSNLVDAVEDARRIAKRVGRQKVILSDLKSAVRDSRMPSDDRAAIAFSARVTRGRRSYREQPLQPSFNGDSEALKASASRDTFPDSESVENPRLRSSISSRTDRDLVTN